MHLMHSDSCICVEDLYITLYLVSIPITRCFIVLHLASLGPPHTTQSRYRTQANYRFEPSSQKQIPDDAGNNPSENQGTQIYPAPAISSV